MDTGNYLEEHCRGYQALNSGNTYVAKRDVFRHFVQQIRDAASELGLAVLPKKIKKFIDDYEKKFEGTWEFALFSEWTAAYEDNPWKNTKNVTSSNRLTILSEKLKALQKIVNLYPAVFLPYTNANRRKIVRLFKDGKNSFAMIDELEHALNGTPYKKNPLVNWETVDFKTVLEMTKGQHVELLVTPIKRGEGSIRTPIGTSCMLAVDMFMNVIHITTFIAGIFKWNCYKVKLSKLVARIREYFLADKKERFFMTEQTRNLILSETKDEFLELIVYNIDRVNSYESSVVPFMRMFPEMMEFYHNQKHCEVFKLKNCRWCPKVVKIKEEGPTFEEAAMEMLEELEKEARKQMNKKMKKMRQKASKIGISESQSQVPDLSRKTVDAPIMFTKDIHSTSAPSQKKQSPEAQKQSNRCDFCPETSKKCDAVSSKLKTMINQNKKLDEKLKDLETEEAEKPREELENELEEKLKRIQELRERNQRLKELKSISEPRIDELQATVGTCRFRIKQGVWLNTEKDRHIRVLKQHVPSDVLSGINERFENLRL